MKQDRQKIQARHVPGTGVRSIRKNDNIRGPTKKAAYMSSTNKCKTSHSEKLAGRRPF
jgi:hypothetical protein